MAGTGVPFDIVRAVQAGYTVVIQDVRGRYASEGLFHAHFQEALDGADTIAWAAAQPWSLGIVGGISYTGEESPLLQLPRLRREVRERRPRRTTQSTSGDTHAA